MIMNIQFFGGRGSGGGKRSGGGGSQAIDEDANPDYRYHSTSFEALEKIEYEGLKQSKRGEYGKGVYFAPSVEGTKGWTSELNEEVNLRVSKQTLKSKYGYGEFPEQGLTSKNVKAADIQIKADNGKWYNIKDIIVSKEVGRRKYHINKGPW